MSHGDGIVLQAYAQLPPGQRIAVSELCSKLINTCKLPAGYAPDIAYYLVSLERKYAKCQPMCLQGLHLVIPGAHRAHRAST